jgi:fibronectin type 3 domain-containing protein
MKKLSFSLLFSALSALMVAQNSVSITTKIVGDSLRIKAVPNTLAAWKAFKEEGLFLFSAASSNFANLSPLNSKALQPMKKEDLMKIKDKFTEVAAASLYPEENKAKNLSLAEKMVYQKQLEANQFFYLFATAQSRALSKASGLEFTITRPDSVLYLTASFGLSKKFNGQKIIEVYSLPPALEAPFFEGINGEHSVGLRWNYKEAEEYLLAYNVLRASRKSGPYEKVNEAPLIYNQLQDSTSQGFIWFTDSLAQNYQPYFYKLEALDYFGDKHQSKKAAQHKGVDRTPPTEVFGLELSQPLPSQVKVSWQMDNAPADLAGFFVVYSSEGVSGPFENTHEGSLDKIDRTFTIGDFEPKAKNYFSVVAYDTSGNYSVPAGSFLFTVDSLPPELPLNLNGTIDSNGVVSLQWSPSNSKDVKAYRLFRTVNKNYEFMPVAPGLILDTTYVDTVDMTMLDQHYYYKIVALDRNYNHSKLSAALHLVKPDLLPPTSPILEKPQLADGVLTLRWVPSSSDDVQQYEVFRGRENDELEFFGQVRGFRFSDSLNESGSYTYAIRATDQSGLTSPFSNPRQIDLVRPLVLNPPNFSLSAQEAGVELKLASAQNLRVLVYRAKQKNNAPLRLYRTIEANALGFTDKQVESGQVYRYAVVLIDAKGQKSARSSEQSVAFGPAD